jgi:hypothetical protein
MREGRKRVGWFIVVSEDQKIIFFEEFGPIRGKYGSFG